MGRHFGDERFLSITWHRRTARTGAIAPGPVDGSASPRPNWPWCPPRSPRAAAARTTLPSKSDSSRLQRIDVDLTHRRAGGAPPRREAAANYVRPEPPVRGDCADATPRQGQVVLDVDQATTRPAPRPTPSPVGGSREQRHCHPRVGRLRQACRWVATAMSGPQQLNARARQHVHHRNLVLDQAAGIGNGLTDSRRAPATGTARGRAVQAANRTPPGRIDPGVARSGVSGDGIVVNPNITRRRAVFWGGVANEADRSSTARVGSMLDSRQLRRVARPAGTTWFTPDHGGAACNPPSTLGASLHGNVDHTTSCSPAPRPSWSVLWSGRRRRRGAAGRRSRLSAMSFDADSTSGSVPPGIWPSACTTTSSRGSPPCRSREAGRRRADPRRRGGTRVLRRRRR